MNMFTSASDVQEVCGSSGLVRALVLGFAKVPWILLLCWLLTWCWSPYVLIFSARLHGHRHSCPVQPCTRVYAGAYTQFAQRLFRQKTLQDELKVQSSPLPWKKAVEQLCMMLYKITVHAIFPTPLVSMNHGNYIFSKLKVQQLSFQLMYDWVANEWLDYWVKH